MVNSYNTHLTRTDTTTGQHWSHADSASLSIAGDITIEMWINYDTWPGDVGDHYGLSDKDQAGAREWQFMLLSNGDLRMFYWSDDATYTHEQTDASPFTSGEAGEWHHVAMTADVSAQDVKFYKDGVLQASTTITADATSMQDDIAVFHIGSNRGIVDFFDGKIDDFRLWSVVRTQDEIANNMWTELKGDETNLQGYWKFNNDGLDETSNNNDLTNNNSATFQTETPFLNDYNGALALGSF